MESVVVGAIGIAAVLLLMFLGVPVAISFAAMSLFGVAYLIGWPAALSQLGRVPFTQASHFLLLTIPMFVLMGELLSTSGMGANLYEFFQRLVRRMPGGLAIATVLANAVFGAACGSSVAAAATFGHFAIPEMQKHRYSPLLSTGCVAAAGTLSILIPPSGSFIIYGLLTDNSIGRLFIAGIIPGIVLTVLFSALIVLWVKVKPGTAPPGGEVKKRGAPLGLYLVIITFAIVMGGIYGGVFTAVEAGAIGTFVLAVILFATRRLSRKNLGVAASNTVMTTCMIFAILIGAMLFNVFVGVSGLPTKIASIVDTLEISRYAMLALIIFVYVILGCIMDALAMLVLTIPIFYPLMLHLGFDPIWFGVLLVILIEMAMITPPVGMNIYVIMGVAPHIKQTDIFKGVWPFVSALVVLIFLITIFPQIALFLPTAMKG